MRDDKIPTKNKNSKQKRIRIVYWANYQDKLLVQIPEHVQNQFILKFRNTDMGNAFQEDKYMFLTSQYHLEISVV